MQHRHRTAAFERSQYSALKRTLTHHSAHTVTRSEHKVSKPLKGKQGGKGSRAPRGPLGPLGPKSAMMGAVHFQKNHKI